jgi:hypothetical protein
MIASDGQRCWQVYRDHDQVTAGPAAQQYRGVAKDAAKAAGNFLRRISEQ